MSKVLTISIAAYNVEKYIRQALDSLLIKDIDKLEILVEDDGGTDGTADIVKEYEKKYPNSIKLVHKKNGGYGSTINKSIGIATGKYFKQLDGDDWYDKSNLQKLVNILEKINSDVVYSPYVEVYEKNNLKKTIDNIEIGEGEYKISEVLSSNISPLVMHSLMYKTKILKDNNIKIEENCFYTDTEYALYPLYYAKTIYINKKPIYYYRIGLSGQSISLSSRRKNYNMRILVDKKLLSYYDKNNKKLHYNVSEYIKNYLKISLSGCILNFLLILDISKDNFKNIYEFDKFIYKNNKEIYEDMNNNKAIKLLRKRNYFIYIVMHHIKVYKLR